MTARELAAELLKSPPDAEVVIEGGNIHLHIAAVKNDDGETTFIHAWPHPGGYPL